jgi:hypothetical protein
VVALLSLIFCILGSLLVEDDGQVSDWLAVSEAARILEWYDLCSLVIASTTILYTFDSLCHDRTNAILSALSVIVYMVQVCYRFVVHS